MIGLACHAVAQCCPGLAGEVGSSVLEGIGGPTFAASDPVSEVRRVARISEIEQVAFDRYRESRDATDDASSNEWVQRADPLEQYPVALSLMARLQDGDTK